MTWGPQRGSCLGMRRPWRSAGGVFNDGRVALTDADAQGDLPVSTAGSVKLSRGGEQDLAPVIPSVTEEWHHRWD